jgi:hypothetical protein
VQETSYVFDNLEKLQSLMSDYQVSKIITTAIA